MQEKAIHLIKQYKTFIITMLVFGFIAYYLMISQQLTNQLDAFWIGKYHIMGGWELGEGRFMWYLLNPLAFGLQLDSYSTLLGLFFIALGFSVLHHIFFESQKPDPVFYIISAIFITAAGIRSQLSYRYLAPFYCFAFLCSMLSAWFIIYCSNHILSVLAGSIFLMIAMGIYQSYMGCTLLVLLTVFLIKIYRDDKKKNLIYLIRCVSSGLLGLILYVISMKLSFVIGHIEMTTRVGQNGLSFTKILKSVPENCVRCFTYMYMHFVEGQWAENILQDHLWLFGGIFFLFFIGTCILLCNMIKEKKYGSAIIFTLLHLFIPIFSCCLFFIGTDINMNIQTTIAVDLIIPLYFIMLRLLLPSAPPHKKIGLVYRGFLFVWIVLLLYGNFLATQVDQQAMMEGKEALTAMCDDMLDDLAETGYFDIPREARKPIAVLGSAVRNDQFKVTPVFYQANIYARMGDFESDCERVSWESAFREFCYKDVSFVNLNEYYELLERNEVKEMPLYPARGYLQELDDVFVLRVSEN